jgi:hypothetical protein
MNIAGLVNQSLEAMVIPNYLAENLIHNVAQDGHQVLDYLFRQLRSL